MKAFIEILREKYGLAQPEAEKLLEQMELLTYRKGEHIVREGERNSSFYLVADGIWRGTLSARRSGHFALVCLSR